MALSLAMSWVPESEATLPSPKFKAIDVTVPSLSDPWMEKIESKGAVPADGEAARVTQIGRALAAPVGVIVDTGGVVGVGTSGGVVGVGTSAGPTIAITAGVEDKRTFSLA